MALNVGYLTSNRTESGDEVYTPFYAVEPLLEFIPKDKTIWCPCEKHPKFALYENVKNIVGKKFKPTFDLFIEELHEYGYNTYYKVLNAKDFGVPQNRERVYIFIVDKTLDNGKFEFPQPFDNGVRLKDVLEDEVEEKYYLSEKMVNGFIKHNSNHEAKGTGFIWRPRDKDGVASTLRANAALCPTDNTIET